MTTNEFRVMLYRLHFEEVRSFYANTLRFPIIKEWNRSENDRGTMFDVGGTILELLTPEDDYNAIAGCGLSLGVPNVHELWQKFQNEKFITLSLRHNSWGDTSFQITDPEGLKITLFTNDQGTVHSR